MYASFGLSALLNDAGMATQIIGGDFLCAVVSQDGSRMTLQGFGSQHSELPSHYWIEAQGTLIDLGPTFLPIRSSYPSAPLPVIRWPLISKLPNFITYRETKRYTEGVKISDPIFFRKNCEFVAHCRKLNRDTKTNVDLGAWQLTDWPSLQQAANAGDFWARAMFVFLKRSMRAEFPF